MKCCMWPQAAVYLLARITNHTCIAMHVLYIVLICNQICVVVLVILA
jgi:hypothetical protein